MGIVLHQKEPVILGIWKIEESVDELFSLLSTTHPSYLSFLEKKVTENRKKEWLATRVLLKELVGKEQIIAYHLNGAPYLVDSLYSISISHTRGFVAVILHKELPVGIDIEYIGERILKVRDKFMTPKEEASIDVANEVNHLLLHWCAKETLFKIVGEENVDFKECLHIESFPYNTNGHFTGYETRTPFSKKYDMIYFITEEFVLTYTVEDKL